MPAYRLPLLATAAFVALAGTAQAAPQALGLVATLSPVPLICDTEGCQAEFSAFCLQQDRDGPRPFTAYSPAEAGSIRVTATRADGSSIDLPAEALKIVSRRGHSAVAMSLPATILAQFGATQISIAIQPRATLLPPTVAGDLRPQSADDLAMAVGPMRQVGHLVVDADDRAAAAQIIGRVSVRLPGLLRYQPSAEERQAAWDQAVDPQLLASASPGALHQAKAAHAACDAKAAAGYAFGMRQCLATEHDRLMNGLNQEYWKALDSGS